MWKGVVGCLENFFFASSMYFEREPIDFHIVHPRVCYGFRNNQKRKKKKRKETKNSRPIRN